MLFSFPTVAATSLWLTGAVGFLPEVVAQDAHQVRQVAIIGAGAAGSSAAYYLRTFAEENAVAVNITVFEKTDRIGGRTLTINPFGNSSQSVELGASIFIKKNHIMYDALREFGLEPRDPDVGSDPELGIWDGDSFVFQINENHSFWWNAGKVFLKYGFLAPRRTQKLVETTINKFLKLYDAPFFPFRSLSQRAYELDLVETTGVTGEQLLKANKVGDLYAHDIVQATTRVNYASNLARIHGLDTMVSMAPEGAMTVKGGNWQIFHGMVKKSGAHVALNTSVVSIDLAPEKHSSDQPQYVLRTKSLGKEEDHPAVFDNIVLATPYQFSKISPANGIIQHPIDEIPYVQLHVTIFASPFQYSPGFFGLTDAKDVPGTILTTLGKDDEPTSGLHGAGNAGFFSISILRKVYNPETQKDEYLYKIFSPEKVTSDFLSRLFGVEVPNSITGGVGGDDTQVIPISWYYPAVFYSYPQALPRVTFQDPVIGPGLYYTSGMESFISTMETNALMGKNVARLIIDDALGLLTGNAVGEIPEEGRGGAQKVVCDRGRGQGQMEVPKTRPTEPVMVDL